MTYTVAFIGTGPDPKNPSTDGFAMAYRHAPGYQRLDDCELVACADIVRENAEAFARTHDIPLEHVYTDYEEMLSETRPDIVSICTPPSVHAPLVIGTAKSGVVTAIHCEKPMALTWGDAQEMARVCDAEGVQLTINHQKRFGKPVRQAKTLVSEGRIGDVERVEFGAETLYDMGTHFFDICNYLNDGSPVEWVLANIDYTEENVLFGTHNENQAISQWRYANGVDGLASTGRAADFVGCQLRVVGSKGVIELGTDEAELRYRVDGADWTVVDTGLDTVHKPVPGRMRSGLTTVASRLPATLSSKLTDQLSTTSYEARAIEELVAALREGTASELSARHALAAEELIFASWESARRRGRVDLPLDIEDNPLESMVETGDLVLTSPPA
ncbi:Gfo/Idh/MocA family protein [Salinigranum halophilum]|uniref:Gfo/Idh/MocA family protein n=1 Tax=Salinigranum halophilum TaxID=2565931 RepID=UPI0010A76FAA|nr:Gfo/Idh/MocA family oxidoreductase [Salinigranum halophilum]